MSLEAVIYDLEQIHSRLEKESKELNEIILIVQELRGMCIGANVKKAIFTIKTLFSRVELDKKDQIIFSKCIEELFSIEKLICAFSSLDRNKKFTFPRNLKELLGRIVYPAGDYYYREVEIRFPKCLYLSVAQMFSSELGSSEGICKGFVLEGILGFLKEGKLFGHFIGNSPIFSPVVASKHTKSRVGMALNNTVDLGKSSVLQEKWQLRCVEEHFIERELITTGDSILNKVQNYFSAGKKALAISFGHPSFFRWGHVIGIVQNKDGRYIVIDANSGCYLFRDFQVLRNWFVWYIQEIGYTTIYKSVGYDEVTIQDNAEHEINKKIQELSSQIKEIHQKIKLSSSELEDFELRNKTVPICQEQVLNRMNIKINLVEAKATLLDINTNLIQEQELLLRQSLDLGQRKIDTCTKKISATDEISKRLKSVKLKEKLVGKARDVWSLIRFFSKIVYYHFKTPGTLFDAIPFRSNMGDSISEIHTQEALRGIDVDTLNLEFAAKVGRVNPNKDKKRDFLPLMKNNKSKPQLRNEKQEKKEREEKLECENLALKTIRRRRASY